METECKCIGRISLWPWTVPLLVVASLGAMSILFVALVAFLAYLRSPYKAAVIPIKGRHMLITGGSSGIGLEIAKLAAAEGARISLVARDPKKLCDAKNLVADHCKDKGAPVQVNTYSADVKDFGSISVAVDAAVSDSGVIGVLILSHGVQRSLTFEDTTIEDMDCVLDTNLKGTILSIKAALPNIQASKGAPAAISIHSSQAGQVGVYGYGMYASSKFALRGLAEVLQQELLHRNIRMSLVYPPDTLTPGYLEDLKTLPELTAKLSATSKVMSATSVARVTLRGLKAGDFHINCGITGAVLSALCVGMSPQPSLVKIVAEVFTMGFIRLYSLSIQKWWYDTILQYKRKVSEPRKTDINSVQDSVMHRW